MPDDWKNKLYFGDNLDIMRDMPSESIDLVYLDPPFNSKASYNVLFKEKDGTDSAAQITAFDDTWQWDIRSEETYHELMTGCPIGRLCSLMEAFKDFLGRNDMMAYLTMMAIRLVEMHRLLKPTGSIYLHCDPTASHYLKLVMDTVFGAKNYKNEIIWMRSTDTGSSKAISKKFPNNSDTILFYSKTADFIFHNTYTEYSEEYLKRFKYSDEKGNYRWQCLRTYSQDTFDRLKKENRVRIGENAKYPEYKQYSWELKGVLVSNIWIDINQINPYAAERLGYPTQKPEALLERIINASSNEGDVVLDPFCGCGTTISVAEKLHRRWIGIDITHLAIALMNYRLNDTFANELAPYEIIGVPKDLESARALAYKDRDEFEKWAVTLINARPAHDKKKGADRGVDGILYFFEDESGDAKKVVVQVKSGHVNRSYIATLISDMEREKAVIGAFITLEEPTKPMIQEAASAGFYETNNPITPSSVRRYPRIQILTIADLLDDADLKYPEWALDITHRQAKRVSKKKHDEQTSFL